MKRYRKQKKKQYLMGGILVVSGIMAVMLLGGDATIALIAVPLGLYLIFTKEIFIRNDFRSEIEDTGETAGHREENG